MGKLIGNLCALGLIIFSFSSCASSGSPLVPKSAYAAPIAIMIAAPAIDTLARAEDRRYGEQIHGAVVKHLKDLGYTVTSGSATYRMTTEITVVRSFLSLGFKRDFRVLITVTRDGREVLKEYYFNIRPVHSEETANALFGAQVARQIGYTLKQDLGRRASQ